MRMGKVLATRGQIAAISAAVWLAFASPSVASASPVNPVSTDGSSVIYSVKPGENLYALARKYLLRTDDYRAVQKFNHIANAQRVPVGTQLRVPVALLRATPLTARLTAFHGAVRLNVDNRDVAPVLGMELATGAVVETGADGFVSLTLPNGSRTSIPTRSRLRIVNLRRFLLTNEIDYDLGVEAGKVETRATHIRPGDGSFRVRTPRAVAAVRGTEFRVGLDDDRSLAEVLDGTVATGAKDGLAQPITKGFGAVVSSDGKLASEALLVPPVLVQPGRVQVDPLVRLTLAEVPGAKAYHVQIAADAGFSEGIAEARGVGPTFDLADIPNGALFVRVSAFAASGLEGMAQTYAMRRVLTGLSASAAADTDGMRFKWSGSGEGRRTYHFQLVREDRRAVPVVDEPGLVADQIVLRELGPGTYLWRVGVRQVAADGVTENWLPFEKLTVASPEN